MISHQGVYPQSVSDLEEDPEEDDEDPEEDLADYPADRDDDDEEEEDDPSGDDAEDEDKDDEEEEDKHLALADSVLPALRVIAMISIQDEPPSISLPPREEGTPGYEIGESSSIATARPTGGHRANYGFVGTMDIETQQLRAAEVDYGIRDTWVDPRDPFWGCYRLVSRAKVIENQLLLLVTVSMSADSAITYTSVHSELRLRALEARVAVLETQANRHEWQRQGADDHTVEHIMRTQALEAKARIDTLEDTGSSS
ncbi:hypothetical protein Tco_1159044 [Tanacetum coccineum]